MGVAGSGDRATLVVARTAAFVVVVVLFVPVLACTGGSGSIDGDGGASSSGTSSGGSAQIERCSTVHQNLVVLDLTGEENVCPTNRFTIYAM